MITIETFTDLIKTYFPEPHSSLLNGILLGRELETTYSFRDKLKEVGLIHIVVLSGMNITLLSSIILGAIVTRVGRKIATLCTIVAIVSFVFFVGIEPPIIRAAIMGILSLIGLLYGRKTLALYTLVLTALVMIIIWPEWLKSISFQLSFAATLGIILFGTGEKKNKDNTILQYMYDELRISLSAQLFTAPLIFFYFRQISFISPLANILVSWVIAPLMILGMITIFLGSIHWKSGFIFSWLCYALLQYIVWIVEWLSKLPFASVKF